LVVKFVYTTNTAAAAAKADYRESAGGGGESNNNPHTKTQETGNVNKSHQQTNSVNSASVVKLIAKPG
jgi:hypothetical protein